MARVLIIGCGCRGQSLAAALRERGHAVRATTRRPARVEELEAVGIDAVLADPDRIVTIAPTFEHVTIAAVLLGSASGDEEHLAALHGTRLEMLLTKLVDTTVRGVIYESRGTVPRAALEHGSAQVRAMCEDAAIPYVLLDADPGRYADWVAAAVGAVDDILGAPISARVS